MMKGENDVTDVTDVVYNEKLDTRHLLDNAIAMA